MTVEIKEGKWYTHVKTGNLYTVVALGRMEATLEPAVVYRCADTNQVWIRPEREFADGRFQPAGDTAGVT